MCQRDKMIFASFFINIFWIYVAGAALVNHKSIQTATVGDNVTLHCQLAGEHNVVQITWQKEHGKTKTNIATYSKTHGSRILGNYQKNMQLFQSGMTISALTFHNASLTDEGCYDCIFNTFPLGSISGKTCLMVYALTEPKVTVKHVTNPNNAGEGVMEISCSATGKPEPVISWKVTKHLLIKPKHYVTNHMNKTVTVVSNFTDISPHVGQKNPIICVISHPSLNTTQELIVNVSMMEETPNKHPGTGIMLGICISVALILLFSVYCCWRLFPANRKRDLQRQVLSICPQTVLDGKYAYILQEVPMKSLHEGKLPNR